MNWYFPHERQYYALADHRQIIIRRGLISAFHPALRAAMNNRKPLLAILIKADRFHQTSTVGAPIAWTFVVNML